MNPQSFVNLCKIVQLKRTKANYLTIRKLDLSRALKWVLVLLGILGKALKDWKLGKKRLIFVFLSSLSHRSSVSFIGYWQQRNMSNVFKDIGER